MVRAVPLLALFALAACNTAGTPSGQQAATPAPTGITAARGGGAQTLGNTGVGSPIAVTPTAPVAR